ncbi:NADH-ubiquinone oxidoreductase subunit E family protein [Sulfurimonas sp. SAG-AH-194-L11]|nr:NADH-ubiquinone oxidoreductase subunit E family protein [Sulfurimonas sp. SAG-AH-194-L11]MDF1877225.1 NADH-ubiquinone oxidoreductase subunit E family protein [Sulfurimonas sp. SAG-AH-194-L11]
MKRYDLRHLKNDFEPRMKEILGETHKATETLIFLFEIGDFTPVQRSADLVKECGYELYNSLKFNEVDWTIVVKKD